MDRSLFDRAVRFLSVRAHSRRELFRKLRRYGEAEDVEAVLDRLVELGYLDDTLFAISRAKGLRERSRWGNLRISLDLKRLGLDAKIIRLALRRLDGEIPETTALHQVVERWLKVREHPRTLRDLKKLYDHCLRLGYPPELVRTELEQVSRRVGAHDQELT